MSLEKDEAELTEFVAQTRKQFDQQKELADAQVHQGIDQLVAQLRARSAKGLLPPEPQVKVARPAISRPARLEQAGPFPDYDRVLSAQDVVALGAKPDFSGKTIKELASAMRPPALPQPTPGSVQVVIGQTGSAEMVREWALRLAGRIDSDAQVLLSGAKTLLPGTGDRVRTAADLQKAIHEGVTTVLAVVDSAVPSHQRTAQRLLEAAEPAFTWAIGQADDAQLEAWLAELPAGIDADALVLDGVWDAPAPLRNAYLSAPVSVLEGAPAKAGVWAALISDRI